MRLFSKLLTLVTSFVTLMHMQLPGTWYIIIVVISVILGSLSVTIIWWVNGSTSRSCLCGRYPPYNKYNILPIFVMEYPMWCALSLMHFRPLYSYRILSNQTNTSSSMLLIVNSAAFLVFVRLMQSLQTCPHMPTTNLLIVKLLWLEVVLLQEEKTQR